MSFAIASRIISSSSSSSHAPAALHHGADIEDLPEVVRTCHKVDGVQGLVRSGQDLLCEVVRAAKGEAGRGCGEDEGVVW